MSDSDSDSGIPENANSNTISPIALNAITIANPKIL